MNTFAVITSVYNEEDMLPFFLRHYSVQGASKIIMLDNMSTDRTVEIASQYPDFVFVDFYSSQNQIDDRRMVEVMMKWKEHLIGEFKYVLLVSCDELIVSRNHYFTLQETLEKQNENILATHGFNMIQHRKDNHLKMNEPLTAQRTYGFYDRNYSKPVIVKPEFICTYAPGLHFVSDVLTDEMLHPELAKFLLLHYVAFDETISLKRRIRQGNRIGEINKKNGYGIGNAGMTEAQWREWLVGHWNHSEIRKVI